MKFDAKHSYEDKVIPVEEAYERWGSRIAILGGYALGTGNSVPDYVPDENYFAMISAVKI